MAPPTLEPWAARPPLSLSEQRDAAKLKRQQDARDRRAQRARSKEEIMKLREEFPQRIPTEHAPAPELGAVFEILDDQAVTLLKEIYREIMKMPKEACPVCRALKVLHPARISVDDCKLRNEGGAEIIFNRAFKVFIGPGKTEPVPVVTSVCHVRHG